MRVAALLATLVVLVGLASAFDATLPLPPNSLQPGLVETSSKLQAGGVFDRIKAGAAKVGEGVKSVGAKIGNGITNVSAKVGQFLGAKPAPEEDGDGEAEAGGNEDDDGEEGAAPAQKIPSVADPSSALTAAKKVVAADRKTGAPKSQVKDDLAQLAAQQAANLAAQKKAAQASLEANLMDAQGINDQVKGSSGQKKFKAPGPGEHLPEADLMGEAPRTSLSSSDVDAIARAILKERKEDCKKGSCGKGKGKGKADATPITPEEKGKAAAVESSIIADHKKTLKGEKPDEPAPAKAAASKDKGKGGDKGELAKVDKLLDQAKKLAKALSSAAGGDAGSKDAPAKKDAAADKDAPADKKDAPADKKDAPAAKDAPADKKDAPAKKEEAPTSAGDKKKDAGATGATGTASGTGTGTGSMRFRRLEDPLQTVYFAEQAEEAALRAVADI